VLIIAQMSVVHAPFAIICSAETLAFYTGSLGCSLWLSPFRAAEHVSKPVGMLIDLLQTVSKAQAQAEPAATTGEIYTVRTLHARKRTCTSVSKGASQEDTLAKAAHCICSPAVCCKGAHQLLRTEQSSTLGLTPQLTCWPLVIAAGARMRPTPHDNVERHQGVNTVPHPQVNLPKPIGVRFGRGNDGGAYVIGSDASIGNTDEKIEARVHCAASYCAAAHSCTCPATRQALDVHGEIKRSGILAERRIQHSTIPAALRS
jgi:hypothetical protein